MFKAFKFIAMKEDVSTHRSYRLDSTDQVHTPDPHILFEDRLPQCTTLLHWAHIGISHMETPERPRTNPHKCTHFSDDSELFSEFM